jgi:molecular chaperone DnaJ
MQVEVPTVDGKVKLKIDAGTQAGKILRLRGKGLPELNTNFKGDQLIHVNVWTPQNISAEEKASLEKLAQSKNFEPNPEKNEKSFFDKVREIFS